MALTTAERAALQAQLTAARSSYHNLMVGGAPRVVVDQNGERVEYTPANRAALKAYIQELVDQLAEVSTRSGPIKVWMS